MRAEFFSILGSNTGDDCRRIFAGAYSLRENILHMRSSVLAVNCFKAVGGFSISPAEEEKACGLGGTVAAATHNLPSLKKEKHVAARD